jgi:hypothetical protein
MSNLEHIFESALVAIEKGFSYSGWRDVMYSSNCAGNAKSVRIAYHDRTPETGDVAILHGGQKIRLMDIWELAQYTYPLIKIAEDPAKEGPNIFTT